MMRKLLPVYFLLLAQCGGATDWTGTARVVVSDVGTVSGSSGVCEVFGTVREYNASGHTSCYANMSNDTFEFWTSGRTYNLDSVPDLVWVHDMDSGQKRAASPKKFMTDSIWLNHRSNYPDARWFDNLFPCGDAQDSYLMSNGYYRTTLYGAGVDGYDVYVSAGNPIPGLPCQSARFRVGVETYVVLPSYPMNEWVINRANGQLIGKRTCYGYLIQGIKVTALQEVYLEYIDANGVLQQYQYSKAVNAFVNDVTLDSDGDGHDDITEILRGSNPLHPDKVPGEGNDTAWVDPNLDLEVDPGGGGGGGGDGEGDGDGDGSGSSKAVVDALTKISGQIDSRADESKEILEAVKAQLEFVNGGSGGLSDSMAGWFNGVINKLGEVKDAIENQDITVTVNSGLGGGGEGEGDGEDGNGSYTGDDISRPEKSEGMAFEVEYESTLEGLQAGLAESRIGFSGLDQFQGKDFSVSIPYPVGGSLGNIRYEHYQFSLTRFPDEIDAPVNSIRVWINVFCKALISLLFIRHLWALLWRF